MDISFVDLRSFVVVAESGSFRDAALTLNISQPALTRRIQTLEEDLGAQLFDRTTRRVELTLAGKELLPRAQILLDRLDDSMMTVRELSEHMTGTLSIACIPTVAGNLLLRALKIFGETYPRVRVRISDVNTAQVVINVLRGDADIGICVEQDQVGTTFQSLLVEPLMLVCSRKHPLAALESATWSDLLPYRLIAVGKTSAELIEPALSPLKIRLLPIYEVQTLSMSLNMVEAGLGVAALPKMSLPKGRYRNVVSIPLKDPIIKRTVGMLWSQRHPITPLARVFQRMMAAQGMNT